MDMQADQGIATLHVQCPECDVVVPITVRAELTELGDGRQGISLDPDLTELWAHSWIHDQVH